MDRFAGLRIDDRFVVVIMLTIDHAAETHPSLQACREAIAVFLFTQKTCNARPLVAHVERRDLAAELRELVPVRALVAIVRSDRTEPFSVH